MYNGIGLQTPRGSGTNGYIQSNKFFLRPKSGKVVVDNAGKGFGENQGMAGVTKKPNKDILEHDRKRQIELKLAILEDTLINQGYTEAEIEDKLKDARNNLEAAASAEEVTGGAITGADKVSDTQTHQIAARKEKQMETLRAALGISTSEFDNQKKQNIDSNSDESNDDDDDDRPVNKLKEGLNEDGKQHGKDPKNGNDDVRMGAKSRKNEGGEELLGSRSHKKQESKRRKHGDDSSDAGSSGEHVKRTKKKHRKSNRGSDSESDSDNDVGKKKQKSREHKKSRRHDIDDSDSDPHNGEKYQKARRVHDFHDDDSSSDEGPDYKTQKGKHRLKSSRRHDSDSDDDEKYEVSRKRHDLDDYGSSFKDGHNHESEKGKRRHDSEDDTDTDSGEKNKRNHSKKNQQSGNRRIERDDFVPDGPQKISNERRGRSDRRYDPEYATDSDSGEKNKRTHTKKNQQCGNRRIEKDDFVPDGPLKISNERHGRSDRRYDPEDDTDSDSGEKNRRIHTKKNQQSGNRRIEKDDFVPDGPLKISNERHGRSDRRYDVESDSDSDGGREHRKKEVEKKSSRRRHDIDEDDVDIGYGEKVEKNQRSWRYNSDGDGYGDSHRRSSNGNSGSDADYKREKIDKIKYFEKNRGDRGDNLSSRGGQSGRKSSLEEKGLRSSAVGNDDRRKEKSGLHNSDVGLDTFRKLEEMYQSKRDTVDKSGYEDGEMIRSKKKVDSENEDEQPKAKSRSRNAGKEIEHNGEQQMITKTRPETNSRSHRNKDEQRRDDKSARGGAFEDDKSARGGGFEDDKSARGGRSHSGGELHRENRSDRDYKDRGGRRHTRDDEEYGGRKHARDEEDIYGRHGKDENYRHHGSRRRGREEEEDRESGREKRDRQVNSSKRVKYDDSRSNERRRYDNEKSDDGRTRH
ncbi:uncharacterized protein LOC132308808 [Cornus florida]|uniref:uncharacterized protein LOC132308808 n=1 Tax=Cornus florida TaxID=4283 RepID=UPI0028967B59|nr:uncharacterized protein LOC132308808 [Cornus florida]